MVVVMLAGVLAGCGGSSKHVEMSDRVREDFINDIQDYELNYNELFLGRDGRYSSAVIIDMEINGAPIVVCKNTGTERETLYLLYRDASGFFDDYGIGSFESNEDVYINIEKKMVILLKKDGENQDVVQVNKIDPTVAMGEAFIRIADGWRHETVSPVFSLYGEEGLKDRDDFESYEDPNTAYGLYLNNIDSMYFNSVQEFDDYVDNEYVGKDAISVKELFSDNNVYTTTAELLDAWEEY